MPAEPAADDLVIGFRRASRDQRADDFDDLAGSTSSTAKPPTPRRALESIATISIVIPIARRRPWSDPHTSDTGKLHGGGVAAARAGRVHARGARDGAVMDVALQVTGVAVEGVGGAASDLPAGCAAARDAGKCDDSNGAQARRAWPPGDARWHAREPTAGGDGAPLGIKRGRQLGSARRSSRPAGARRAAGALLPPG